VGRLSDAWNRWVGQGGPGSRWPRLSAGQAQFTRYLVLLLAVGVLLMSFSSRDGRQGAGELAPGGTPRAALGPGAAMPPPPDGAVIPAAASGAAAAYARELEAAVRAFLAELHGAQRVHVSITLAAGPELILAEQVSRERRVSQEPAQGAPRTVTEERYSAQPVLVRRDQGRQEEALVLMERTPPVQGVVVVADVAADSRLRLEMSRAVATFLGIPVHKVYVLAPAP